MFKRKNINVITNAKIEKVTKSKTKAKVFVEGHETLDCDKVLMAVGVSGNIQKLGLEELSISTKNGFIEENEYMQTNIDNIYAIGDVCGPPMLAHVASFEGSLAAEHISNKNTEKIREKKV